MAFNVEGGFPLTQYLVFRALGLGARFQMNGNYISFIEKEMIYSNAVVANKNELDFSINFSENFIF